MREKNRERGRKREREKERESEKEYKYCIGGEREKARETKIGNVKCEV